jgi:4-diphosphocytidyl-2-C-methyl-D-erythritol kinase
MPRLPEAGDFDLIEDAPAKINLALHVTGRRPDGYHLLDMLVTFADHGDRLGFRLSPKDAFSLAGRFADRLREDAGAAPNHVERARDLMREAAASIGHPSPPVHIHLRKNLPIASGIGGGSADAAAVLRGLSRVWRVTLPPATVQEIALKLGADVPMCLASRPLIACGIGEEIRPLPHLPSFSVVLGNPLKGVSTPEVFGRLEKKDNPGFSFEAGAPRSRDEWLAVMRGLRNDLEPPARAICGEIFTLLELMEQQPGARLVRMSGSGATCFALFDDAGAAGQAAAALHRARPDWYFQAIETMAGAG